MGIEPLQGSPAAAPVISSRTEVSLSAPGVIAHCSCHTAFSEWILVAHPYGVIADPLVMLTGVSRSRNESS